MPNSYGDLTEIFYRVQNAAWNYGCLLLFFFIQSSEFELILLRLITKQIFPISSPIFTVPPTFTKILPSSV